MKGKRLRCLMAYRKRVRFADCRKGRPARRTRSRSRVEDSKVRSGGKDFWRSTISVIFSFSTTSSNGRDRRRGENELPYHLNGHAVVAPALVAYRLPRNVEAILTKACLSRPWWCLPVILCEWDLQWSLSFSALLSPKSYVRKG